MMPATVEDERMEQLVIELLRPPALDYIRTISRILERDPDYLQFHSASVSIRIKELLTNTAIPHSGFAGPMIQRIVREAVVRLRSVEK